MRWAGYLPSQLYNLDASSFGGEQLLKELIDALHAAGRRVVADIVINHRCGDFQDADGNWTIFEGAPRTTAWTGGPGPSCAGTSPSGAGRQDTGEDYGGSAGHRPHQQPRAGRAGQVAALAQAGPDKPRGEEHSVACIPRPGPEPGACTSHLSP